MIGSIQPRFGVYQGSQDADMFGAKPLLEYLNSTGKAAYYGSVSLRVFSHLSRKYELT